MADLSNIGASDGTGEAVQATVTAIRTAPSTSITVNSVTHWPAAFIATSGKLLTNNTLDPTSIFVFSGHLSSGKIIIDAAAPGYTDPGNQVNDVILVKPTTSFADTLQTVLRVSHNDNGSLKNGIVTSSSIADGTISYADLSGVIFGSQVQSYVPSANSLTSGVTIATNVGNYINLGGIKIVWGYIALNYGTVSGNNAHVNNCLFPASFFSTAPSVSLSVQSEGNYAYQFVSGDGVGTSGFGFYVSNMGSSGSAQVSFIAIGS